MHSSAALSHDTFTLAIDGRPAGLGDLLPGFDDRDRLGVVVRDSCGAVGASVLLLAAVTGFFDCQRARSDDFFIYPDYFLFHVEERHGDFNMIEIWPDHKEVVVADDAETLLRAINDRGITRLVVPDGEPGAVELSRHTRSSAENRIVTALVYSPGGRVRNADVTIQGDAVTESYVDGVLNESTRVPADVRDGIRMARRALAGDAHPEESYRRIGLAEALALLAPRTARQSAPGVDVD